MIVAERLTKQFRSLTAVREVSFTAYQGEVFGLVGENGAGKTTTLRMLATLLQPDRGTALVNGKDLRREPEAVRAQLGVLFEGGVYDRLTARENLRYFGHLYGVPAGVLEQKIQRLIDGLGMSRFADRRAGRLSKGMRQKIALARILVHDPPVLILDEPTSGLDVPSARMVHAFILQAKTEGRTILVSSHNMGEIEKLCDRVAVIHRGRIIRAGPVSQLRREAGDGGLEELFVKLVGEES